MLLQFPALHKVVGDTHTLSSLDSKGIPVLLQLLEILQHNPQISNQARLLERCRGESFYPHLQKLATETLDFDDADKLSADFQGIIKTLRADAENARYALLTSKPFSQLSASERDELKAYKRV